MILSNVRKGRLPIVRRRPFSVSHARRRSKLTDNEFLCPCAAFLLHVYQVNALSAQSRIRHAARHHVALPQNTSVQIINAHFHFFASCRNHTNPPVFHRDGQIRVVSLSVRNGVRFIRKLHRDFIRTIRTDSERPVIPFFLVAFYFQIISTDTGNA